MSEPRQIAVRVTITLDPACDGVHADDVRDAVDIILDEGLYWIEEPEWFNRNNVTSIEVESDGSTP